MSSSVHHNEGTEISTDGILLVLKFVETFMSGSERRIYQDLKAGDYVSLDIVRPLWESMTESFPDQFKAAIKGMIYTHKKLLDETGARSPADALRVSNLLYQTFTRGPRIGGREVVAEGENEVVVDDSTWPGCRVAVWFIDAYVRAFGAKGVRIDHLEPCRNEGNRECRYRVRWTSIAARPA
jgi:hypothetical protein